MLHDPIHNAVICIGSLMVTLDPLKPRVPRNPERNPIPRPQLLQLRHDTVSNDRRRLGVQTVHHGLNKLQLLLDAEVDEIGID